MTSTDRYFQESLGVKAGKALGMLKKSIMFSLVVETKRNICYRCGKEIESVDDFSIEHMESWKRSDNPIDKFYNLNNIAFSHETCNRKAVYHSEDYCKGKRKIKLLKIYKNS